MMNVRFQTVLALGALLMLGAVLAQNPPEGYKPERLEITQPEYPRKAYRDAVEGYVDLEVTVAPDGKVEDVDILDAEPRQVFERSAIRAVLRWKYRPPSEDGITVPVKERIRLSFRIDMY